MDSTLLGVVLDSSVLIAAERRGLTALQTLENVRHAMGDIPLVVSSMTIAEIGHGIYRAQTADMRNRRRAFLDDLKATVPIHAMTGSTAEIIARISGEQAAKGISVPLGDLIIGACALELGYAIATGNARDFARLPGLRIVSL